MEGDAVSEIKGAGQRVTIEKAARMLPVTARAVIGPTTPVVKIDGRLLPVSTIRGGIRKDIPTFASIQASQDIATWLPDALSALAAVIDAAIAGVPPELQAEVTPELRLQAVRNSAAQFSDELCQRVARVIVGQEAPDAVSKRTPGSWTGML
jgi:hypothetical protein